MLSPPSESQSTGATVALGGAALAASAMLAGIAFRNRSPLPLAAGFAAAAASLGLMKKIKGEDASSEPAHEANEALPAHRVSRFQILDECDLDVEESEEESPDWVDSPGVFSPHMCQTLTLPSGITPPPAPALPTHATSFPLLDDEGNVIIGHQMLPVQLPQAWTENSAEFGYPLGPLIWGPETGDNIQICEEPGDNILWFGPVGAELPPPAQFECEMVMTAATPVPMPRLPATPSSYTTPFLAGQDGNWGVLSSLPPAPSQTPAPHPESVASILESLRTEAALRGETAATASTGLGDSAPSMAARGPHGSQVGQLPMSFADWMLSTQAQASQQPQQEAAPSPLTPASLPSPVPEAGQRAFRTTLPSPRRPGLPPKNTPDDLPHEPFARHLRMTGGGTHGVTNRSGSTNAASNGPSEQSPVHVFHRSVAPMAPVDQEDSQNHPGRPHTTLLVALILTVALITVAIWGDDFRSRKVSTPPAWTQDPVPAKMQSTAASVQDP